MALMDWKLKLYMTPVPPNPSTLLLQMNVPEVEWTVWTVKDCMCGVYNTLPFIEGIPTLMTVEIIQFIVLLLNAFPIKSSISKTCSPRELVQCHKLSARIYCKTFGSYCEVHDKPDPSNSMQFHTHETICMGPTDNAQGSNIYCLQTKKSCGAGRTNCQCQDPSSGKPICMHV